METKKSWKLKDFIAHTADVKCLGLGHKSGRVMVTGGDDRKVNLWSVGKPQCIMSLIGHTTSIESVRFNSNEELVVAGSYSGALKIWDLEGAKSLRTLTGHKAGIKSLDFHPYGNYIASGSADCNVKLWDVRRKGCIYTYKSHTDAVNCLRFTPDGNWIASASADNTVKIWDLTAGKLLSELKEHSGSVNIVEFHPSDLLLASGSSDRTVKFWDLESFKCISSSDTDRNPVRSIHFHPDGSCMYSANGFSLKVYSWEPFVCHEVVPVSWNDIADMAVANSQLIAASYNKSNVSTYVVDLKEVAPMKAMSKGDSGQAMGSSRRSFITERPQTSCSSEQSEPKRSTTPSDKCENEDDGSSSRAEIQNQDEYRKLYLGKANTKNKAEPFHPPFEEDYSDPVRGVPAMRKEVSPRARNVQSQDNSRNVVKESPQNKDAFIGDDFLPKSSESSSSNISERELVEVLSKGHNTMVTVLDQRSRNLQIVQAMWSSGNTKSAIDSAISMKDKAVLVDLLNIINGRASLWNLDISNLVLPVLKDLLCSKYESHITTAANSVKLVLRSFGSTIKSNMESPPSGFVDISREERHKKCLDCYNVLSSIKALIKSSQTTTTPKVASDFKEIMLLLSGIE